VPAGGSDAWAALEGRARGSVGLVVEPGNVAADASPLRLWLEVGCPIIALALPFLSQRRGIGIATSSKGDEMPIRPYLAGQAIEPIVIRGLLSDALESATPHPIMCGRGQGLVHP
jgi:hypothetical protein